jgi:tetratricopeptide (TPR) repeat protein
MIADPLRPARLAVRAGRFREAATELHSVEPGHQERAEWLLLNAIAQWRLGAFAASQAAARDAREHFRMLADGDGEMRAENVAAAGAFATGNLDEATAGFHRAHALAEARGDALLAARSVNNLGNVAFYRADHDTALRYYRLAAAGFERLEFHHGLGEALINQSIVARDARRWGEALAAAERALAAAHRASSARVAGQAHANIGEAVAASGDARLGRVHLHRALAIARREDDRLAEVEALRLLGNLESHDGRPLDALEFFGQAHTVASAIDHAWGRAELFRDYAACLEGSGHTNEARVMRERAAAAFNQAGATMRAQTLEAST